MIARVLVRYKDDVPDGPGEALAGRLQVMGFSEVKNARIGKFIELEIEAGDREALNSRLEKMCLGLLSNDLIEEFKVLELE